MAAHVGNVSKINILRQKLDSGDFTDLTDTAKFKEFYPLIHELFIHQSEMEVLIEELKLAQIESESSKIRFEKLYNIAPVPYISIDRSGNILVMNREAKKLFGSENKYYNLFNSCLTESSKTVFSEYLDLLDNSDEVLPCEIETRLADRGTIDLKVRGIRYTESNSAEKPEYLLSLTDITIEKETEKRLRTITDNLNQINDTKNRFLSIIAHDLKSPFHSLLGITEILLEHFQNYKSEPIHKLLDGFEKIVKNQYNLVSNLLTWVNLQSNRIICYPEEIDLSELLEECINLLRYEIDKKNILISGEIAKNLTALSDKTMISSVFLNFLTNAVKFSSINGVISINATETTDFIHVSVRDWGTGISEEKMKVLFDAGASNSSPGTRGEKGTGLGLLIAKEYIEKLSGQLLITSKLGEGTTISFSIFKALQSVNNPIIPKMNTNAHS